MVAALDTFPSLENVALTDMHEEVVNVAKSNVLSATEKADKNTWSIAMRAVARAGDILTPLKGEEPYDLIYE